MKKTLSVALAAAVAGAIIGAVVGLALDGESASATPASTSSSSMTSPSGGTGALTPEQIYRRDAPGVVVITATQTQSVPATPFTPPTNQRVGVLGSGFVINTNGDILTNDHVVQGGTGIRVGFSSGASYPAKVVGTDPSTDVAVVRVKAPASALHPLSFADSATISVGDPVYAIGNPFGLSRTMTAGIVSATGRDIQAPNGLTIANAVQTDAPINHGNSGGPLLDGFGHVIGINDQIEGGTVDGNVGIGFAIPSDTAKSVAAQLIASGHAEHAWLGVQVEPIDPAVANVVRGMPSQGVLIVRVTKGGPAARAGLRGGTKQVTIGGVGAIVGGDAIVLADRSRVRSPQQLGAIVAAHRPGDRIPLLVVRNGKRRTVTVTLGDVPASTP
jgi:S1-C subfamily serine protease